MYVHKCVSFVFLKQLCTVDLSKTLSNRYKQFSGWSLFSTVDSALVNIYCSLTVMWDTLKIHFSVCVWCNKGFR